MVFFERMKVEGVRLVGEEIEEQACPFDLIIER